MSNDFVEGNDRKQVILLPDVLDNYVGENNPVRFIDAFVDTLDLKKLGFKHHEPSGGAGRAPYNPRDLLKLYIYGYLNQIRSSRKLERECVRNLELFWLMKKLAPDFKTISDFRKDNIDSIKPVFKEFVYLCKELDLFGAELVSIDGSKFRAVNSKDRNFTKEKLSNRLNQISEKIERYLKEIEEDDSKSEEKEKTAAERVNKLSERVEQLKQKKSEFEQLLKRMNESGESEVSLTDPDAKLMKSNERLEVCYNAQTAVDSKNKLIVDYDVINISSDRNQLSPMAESARKTLGVAHIDVTADKGYHDDVDIKECVDKGITPYVPEPEKDGRGEVKKFGIPQPEFYAGRFLYDRVSDSYICPAGQKLSLYYWSNNDGNGRRIAVYKTDACFSCPFFMTACTRNKVGRWIGRWEHEDVLEQMRARLKSIDGREKALARKELSEHPFGTMKRAFNQSYLLLKGLRKVKGEIGFTMLAYNMRRAINILGTSALTAALLHFTEIRS